MTKNEWIENATLMYKLTPEEVKLLRLRVESPNNKSTFDTVLDFRDDLPYIRASYTDKSCLCKNGYTTTCPSHGDGYG